MTRLRYLPVFALALALLPRSGSAQEGLDSVCRQAQIHTAGAGDECLAAVQAVVSGQPALGLLFSGGNPTLGSSGGPALSLGFLPNVSAGLKITTVMVRLPDIVGQGESGDVLGRFAAAVPAFAADASIRLTQGASMGPGLAGIGAVSLLGSIGSLLSVKGFDQDGISFGIGGRVHLVNESFVTPGISLSILYRQVAPVSFGDVCPSGLVTIPGSAQPALGSCAGPGDGGEFSMNLTDWSGRALIAKHLFGFGLSGGVGYDRFSSDVDYGFRAEPGASTAYRVSGKTFESTRWKVFGGASYTLLAFTLGLEGGWQPGSSPIADFNNLGSAFDPKGGTWFGSFGGRISL